LATDVLRAVLDTNVIVAAHLSQSPRSPTLELLNRWRRGEFVLLYSRLIRQEYARKLNALDIEQERVADFLNDILYLGMRVPLRSMQIEAAVMADPDDDVFVACAIVGKATHLVTYDPHIRDLGREYRSVQIVDALHFLYLVRGDKPPLSS